MLDVLEVQSTSEKSPPTNTTWFWGGPGQGCSQFGKMILQGQGSVLTHQHQVCTLKSQLCPRFPSLTQIIRWISHYCVYKVPQKSKIKTKLGMTNSEIYYTKLVLNQN